MDSPTALRRTQTPYRKGYVLFFISSDSFQVPDPNLDDLPLINE